MVDSAAGSTVSIGASKRGTRNIIPITGGTTSGTLTGSIVAGGGDDQWVGSSTTLDAHYMLAPNDGEFVLVRNGVPFGALVPPSSPRRVELTRVRKTLQLGAISTPER